MRLTFRRGGVHPPQHKTTAHSPITDIGLPMEVTLSLSQHIGAPARCDLKKGDTVRRGEIVAHASGPVSANVHTPISGTVVKIDSSKNAYGYPVDTVTIRATADDHARDLEAMANERPARSEEEIGSLTPDDIKGMIADAGIVGLGGATFPTKVKLSPPPGVRAELLIVNGAECEPYLTCDHALMREHSAEIVKGTRLLCRAAGVDHAVIAIEDNKPDAIAAMQKATAGCDDVTVVPLKTKYPQGGEKQLIDAVMHREVPVGKLPIAAGAIVQNVATAYAVYQAVYNAMPLIERIVTVTGDSVKSPGNYRVAIGTPLMDLVEAAGGIPADTGKIILGGPMMGRTAVSLDAPMIKGISGIVFIPQAEASRRAPEPCVRCGSCVDVCPMGLEPYLLAILAGQQRWEDAERESVTSCIECGSCSYTCPSSRPLLDRIRLGKSAVTAIIKSRSVPKQQ
ncbi:MAG: electron transport complex subunit RsxC [Pseudoflavonifractor sp.]|nr:electron transport complex subunit RsxC [Pseudoflavonifractor sp.]